MGYILSGGSDLDKQFSFAIKRIRTVVLPSFLASGLWVFSIGIVFAAELCAGITCGKEGEICRITKSGLPLRILVKPDSNIFEADDDTSNVVRGNIPAFSSLYAFEVRGCEAKNDSPFSSSGWYKVGYTPNETVGYIKASQSTQWRSAMTVAYINPGASDRKRVLMFESFDDLDALLSGVVDKAVDMEKVYQGLNNLSQIPDGVRAIEQLQWTDITQKFYLMPILDSEDLVDYYPEGDFRALKVAALTSQSGKKRRVTCDLTASDAEKCLERNRMPGSIDAIDVVWVIDMTLSMQPYIDAVATAVRKTSITLREEVASGDKIRYGLIGYRDSVEDAPWLEFVSRDFTPELLPREEFETLMNSGEVKAASKSTGDFPEEVFAGVVDGINAAWRANSARIIILIGDASSHELGHRKNTIDKGVEAVKSLAVQEKVYIASILLANPEASSDAKIAQNQFYRLAQIDENAAFSTLPMGPKGTSGRKLLVALKTTIDEILQAAATGKISKPSSEENGDPVSGALKRAIRAAIVQYIGKDAEPPADIEAWVADRDLSDFSKRSFDVRVVMTRQDMEELKNLIEGLLSAVRAGDKSDSGFIADAIGGSAKAALDLKIKKSDEFAESEAVPRWIKSLPYKSEALSMSVEVFLQLPADDRTAFENRLAGLVNVYDEILSNTDAWHFLNDQATEDSRVFMLPLRNLP